MDATATRKRILDAAERHYAERGYDGMSMRALTTEAGVNLAAVNYHFGSKKELIHAIFRERILPINTERLDLLKKAQAAAEGSPVALEAILDAYLLPVARRASGPEGPDLFFLRMVGRSLSEDAAFWRRLYIEEFKATADTFKAEIKRTLPELTDEQIGIRYHFCVGAMLGSLVKLQQFQEEMASCSCCRDIVQLFQRLRDFLCAGFRAGLPAGC